VKRGGKDAVGEPTESPNLPTRKSTRYLGSIHTHTHTHTEMRTGFLQQDGRWSTNSVQTLLLREAAGAQARRYTLFQPLNTLDNPDPFEEDFSLAKPTRRGWSRARESVNDSRRRRDSRSLALRCPYYRTVTTVSVAT